MAAVGVVVLGAGLADGVVDVPGVAAGVARDDQGCINDRPDIDAGGKTAIVGSGYIRGYDNRVGAAVAAREGT
jgi:hypothetical protein